MANIIKSKCRVCNYQNQFSLGGTRSNHLTVCSVPAIQKETGEFVNINFYEHINSSEYLFYHDKQLKSQDIDSNNSHNYYGWSDLRINKNDNYCPECKNQTLDFNLVSLIDGFREKTNEIKKSKKELIINAFQDMDLSMLEVLLDDNKTYQKATKKTFLKKIEEVFLEFKNNGDDKLFCCKIFYMENGCVTHLTDIPFLRDFSGNNGADCSGYSIIGYDSKTYINLIFEETEDDFSDIYYCDSFQPNYETIFEGNSMRIIIYEDEKADYKPSLRACLNLFFKKFYRLVSLKKKNYNKF